MPRLPTSLLRHARHEHSFLPRLLRTCRDLPSARNELRWLREYILETTSPRTSPSARHQRLYKLCLQRSKGKPLQYILGSQPFGDLEILCRPGVLIPRPETDSLTTHLAHLLLSHHPKPPTLQILDLCTGTGCIPLLLHSFLHPTIPSPLIHGIDISPLAITLAHKNLHHNTRLHTLHPTASSHISFQQADIFDAEWLNGMKTDKTRQWDVLISNPPYISPNTFKTSSTSASVRKYEPKLALVPTPTPPTPPPTPPSSSNSNSNTDPTDTEIGDTFYPRLLHIAHELHVGVFVVEVADMAQAKRVVGMVREKGVWEGVEVWRDLPGQGPRYGKGEVVDLEGREVRVKGEGEGRAVVAWREGWGGVFGEEGGETREMSGRG